MDYLDKLVLQGHARRRSKTVLLAPVFNLEPSPNKVLILTRIRTRTPLVPILVKPFNAVDPLRYYFASQVQSNQYNKGGDTNSADPATVDYGTLQRHTVSLLKVFSSNDAYTYTLNREYSVDSTPVSNGNFSGSGAIIRTLTNSRAVTQEWPVFIVETKALGLAYQSTDYSGEFTTGQDNLDTVKLIDGIDIDLGAPNTLSYNNSQIGLPFGRKPLPDYPAEESRGQYAENIRYDLNPLQGTEAAIRPSTEFFDIPYKPTDGDQDNSYEYYRELAKQDAHVKMANAVLVFPIVDLEYYELDTHIYNKLRSLTDE